MTKFADLKQGDCFIMPAGAILAGAKVVRSDTYPEDLPSGWMWSPACEKYTQKDQEILATAEITRIPSYRAESKSESEPLLVRVRVRPDGVRVGDVIVGYQRWDLQWTKVRWPVKRIQDGVLWGDTEYSSNRALISKGFDREIEVERPAGVVHNLKVPVPTMIPGDTLNGVSLEEIVRRYEKGMREDRIRTANGKKYIWSEWGDERLDSFQFTVAQKEFTRLVKAKVEEAKKTEKESVKVERDSDYWNE